MIFFQFSFFTFKTIIANFSYTQIISITFFLWFDKNLILLMSKRLSLEKFLKESEWLSSFPMFFVWQKCSSFEKFLNGLSSMSIIFDYRWKIYIRIWLSLEHFHFPLFNNIMFVCSDFNRNKFKIFFAHVYSGRSYSFNLFIFKLWWWINSRLFVVAVDVHTSFW